MANGDIYIVKTGNEEIDFETILICNSTIISQHTWGNEREYLDGDFVAVSQYLTSKILTDSWAKSKFPYYVSDFENYPEQKIKEIFEKSYRIYNLTENVALNFDGSAIPDGEITLYQQYGGNVIDFRPPGTSETYSYYLFPFPLGVEGYYSNTEYAGIGTNIIVTDDDFVTDGEINHNDNSVVKFIHINFRIKDDGGYRIELYYRTTNEDFNSGFWNGKKLLNIDGDPYEPGGGSGIGGGGGDFDNTSTPIDFPSLPTISVVSTGFVTLYSPTLTQLNNLASYMWSDLFDIDGWKKLFADPMDAILGLSIVPVNVPTSGVSEVKVGNISTGVALNKASSQYVEVDCGTINVNEYWGAYLDYSPYTKCEIFLPYVGTRPLSIDDVMGKTIHVKYHVDILSGGLSCFVKCGDSVLYSFIGQCSASIPINSANYTNMLNGVLGIAGSIGSMVATGGASSPAAITDIVNTATNQLKPEVQKSGAMSGAGGMLGMQIPYLILTRPRQALPSNQNKFSGYPSLITVKLSELSGYTEIEKIHLENIPATEVELTELEKLLMEGVIF